MKPEKRELTEVDLFTPVTKQAQDLFGGKDVDSDAETETGDYDLGNEDDEEVTASDLPVTCEDAPVTSPIRCSCNECSKALKSMLGKKQPVISEYFSKKKPGNFFLRGFYFKREICRDEGY